METRRSTESSHKAWRRIAKKERRKRLRRKAAKERDAEEDHARAALERSEGYLNWLQEEESREKEKEKREQQERDERERQWLEEEVRAQKEWQATQERKARTRQQQLEQEAKIRQEFEAKQEAIRKKKEEEKLKREKELKRREELQKQIDEYIDDGIKTPEALREVIDSQPGKELCPFFAKTAACRYGDSCSRNHRRVCLSSVILIPGFYSHFSLEKNSAEYDTDVALEFESSETRQHFREFYKDVLPELESFGRIKTLKYCCNTEVHLRGNLYVEYYTEREAARALRKLKGRWYAGRQLNCEFANFKSWRSAVCGMAKCPKGRACNFLHTFRNPRDEYDIKSPPRWAKTSVSEQESTGSARRSERRSTWEESTRGEPGEKEDWRWSDSPELEPISHPINDDRHRDEDREHRRRSKRDGKYDRSDRSSVRKPRNSELHNQRRRSTSSSRSRKHNQRRSRNSESESTDEEDSSPRTYRVKSRRRREGKNGHLREEARIPCDRKRTKHRRNGDRHSDEQRNSKKCLKNSPEYRKCPKSTISKQLKEHLSRKVAQSAEKSNLEKQTISGRDFTKTLSMTRPKSKWDNEKVESGSSPETTDSDDSDVSTTSRSNDRSDDSPAHKQRRVTSTRLDEWATTESDSDERQDQ